MALPWTKPVTQGCVCNIQSRSQRRGNFFCPRAQVAQPGKNHPLWSLWRNIQSQVSPSETASASDSSTASNSASSTCSEASTDGQQGRGRIAQAETGLTLEGSSAPAEAVQFQAEVISSIDKVQASEWDACAKGSGEVNPFLLHAFLLALEESGSAVKEEGWLPQHVLIRHVETQQLHACIPLYLKGHSYGEYVFDNSWAVLASRVGQRYYPKFQCAVPFTPVTGPRILIRNAAEQHMLLKAAAQTLVALTDEYKISGAHLTFNLPEEGDALESLGYLRRTGIQYHWTNNAYGCFDDFLADLKQPKRNNIRKTKQFNSRSTGIPIHEVTVDQSKRNNFCEERRSVAGTGLNIERLTGADIKSRHWDAFYQFYMNTTDKKWGQAYLTRDFFQIMGETMPEHVLLVMAEDSGRPMAGALNLIGSHALFGRNWGCAYDCEIKHLHFEMCYYQALEAAIERKLPRVEAGAQGEHKLQRGYMPSMTHSSHYIRDPRLRTAIDAYLSHERIQIEYTMEAMAQHVSPYKDKA